jgi:hypothetical protein
MLAATVAELAQFDPLGCRLPVFGLRVIALFAITALQRNDLSGHCSLHLIAEERIQKYRIYLFILPDSCHCSLLTSSFCLLTSSLTLCDDL